jgi:hypothetical protein
MKVAAELGKRTLRSSDDIGAIAEAPKILARIPVLA